MYAVEDIKLIQHAVLVKKQINIDLQVFLVTFFNHLALNVVSMLKQQLSLFQR